MLSYRTMRRIQVARITDLLKVIIVLIILMVQFIQVGEIPQTTWLMAVPLLSPDSPHVQNQDAKTDATVADATFD